MPWCSDDSLPESDVVSWVWGTTEEFLVIAVRPPFLRSASGNEIFISRGPDPVGCGEPPP